MKRPRVTTPGLQVCRVPAQDLRPRWLFRRSHADAEDAADDHGLGERVRGGIGEILDALRPTVRTGAGTRSRGIAWRSAEAAYHAETGSRRHCLKAVHDGLAEARREGVHRLLSVLRSPDRF